MQQLATGLEPVMGQPAITRLEQMYVIAKLEQGQYVYYNQNTKKFSPKDNHASKWTSISAAREALYKLEEKQALKENLLNSLTDEFQTQKAPVVSDYSQKFIRRSQEEVLAQVKETVLFLRHLDEIAGLLRKEISEADGAVLQDILHLAELGQPGIMGKVQIYNCLSQSRIKRRKAKDLLAIIAPLIPAEDNSIDLDKCNDALQNYLKVASTRTYHFKDEQLKNNFKRYLEQSNGPRGQVDDLCNR